jgi:hypothetical protein
MAIDTSQMQERDWFKCEVCKERAFVSQRYRSVTRLRCTCGHYIDVETFRLDNIKPTESNHV